jgi:flagellar motor switch protein FliN/FliY
MSPIYDHENARPLLDAWAENLAQVLESMTDQRPEVHWRAVAGTEAEAGITPDAGVLWWEQKFQCSDDAKAWVATPRQTWEHASTLTLKAAGLETSSPDEIKNTWLEILGQWLSALARSLASHLGSDLTCLAGVESAPGESPREWVLVSLAFGEVELPAIATAFSPALAALLTTPVPSADGAASTIERENEQDSGEASRVPAVSCTMDLLLDVELPVSISFGKTQLPLKDVLRLTTGSIVELNRSVTEPVEILVNHCLIARGEVVVVEGNYGVRIQQIASRQERLRSLR